MQPRQNLPNPLFIIFAFVLSSTFSLKAQCTINYKNANQGVINLVLGNNCAATFDANTHLNINGACSLVYYKDQSMNTQYNSTPIFDASFVGQTIDVFVTADDGNPATPMASPLKFTLRVVDTTTPTITCPDNQTFTAVGNTCSYTVNNGLIASAKDNCSGNVNLGWTLSGTTTGSGTGTLNGTNFNAGQTTVNYVATDVSGNNIACSFVVEIKDIIAPTVVACPTNVNLNASANTCQLMVATGLNPVFSDNCTAENLLNIEYNLSGSTDQTGTGLLGNQSFNVGQTLVKYTARDAFGNANSSCSFNVNIKDIDKPQVVCAANLSVNTIEDSAFTLIPISRLSPFRSDNCGQNNLLTSYFITGATQTGTSALQNLGQQKFNHGVSFLNFIVTDLYANQNTCVQQITVLDKTAPIINCNNNDINTFAETNDCQKAIQLAAPSFSDNCTASSKLELSYLLSGAQNAKGNGIMPSNIIFNAGLTKITYKVVDEAGNSSSCVFNVHVAEGTMVKPRIKCPNDLSMAAPIGLCSTVISSGLNPLSISDNCTEPDQLVLKATLSGATIMGETTVPVQEGANGFTFNLGRTMITYTVIDGSGNQESASFDVNITDKERPILNCIEDMTVTASNGCSTRIPGLRATATDNCNTIGLQFNYRISGATVLNNLTSALDLVDFSVGISKVDCFVQDLAENRDSCTFFIRTIEKNNPVIQCPSDYAFETLDHSCQALVIQIAEPVFTDACSKTNDLQLSFSTSGSSTISGTNSINNSLLEFGKNVVTYTVTDFSGNTSTCTFSIQVDDKIAPKVICPQNTTIHSLDTSCYAIVSSPAITFSDNCTPSISFEITGASNLKGNGVFTNQQLYFGKNFVKYAVTDRAANTAQCSFELFVKDNFKPYIVCPDNVTVPAKASCTANISALSPFTKDNCGAVDLSYAVSGNTVVANGIGILAARSFNLGNSQVTYTAYDLNSNSSTCTFNVNVIDDTAPKAICRPDITIALDNSGNAYMPAVMFDNGSFDNCSTVSEMKFSASTEHFNCSNIGLNTVTLAVQDASGNTSTCSSSVNVVNSFKQLYLSTTINPIDESYWGANDGKIEVKVSGGTGEFNYQWNNGAETAVAEKLATGTYTVTVTDKVSRCRAIATIKLNEGAKLTFTVGNIISTSGTVATVPVRVQNFNKIKAIQFALNLDNGAIGSIEGIENFAINMNDSAEYALSATGIQFRKVFIGNEGFSIPNGTALFNIKIKLDAKVGTFSAISFNKEPSELVASQFLAVGLITIPMNAINGSVGISGGATVAEFKGTVMREDGIPIRDTKVMLSGTYTDSMTTSKDGNYHFDLSLGARVCIKASKSDNVRAGLTAVDALLLQRHILGYQPFNSIYKKIAADVNRSGNLTALDVSEIKRVILGYQPTFRNTEVWRFVPADYVFPDMSHNQVLAYPDSLTNNYVLDNQIEKNLVAIKSGDVNLSANVGATNANGRAMESIEFTIDDRSVSKNEMFEINITSTDKLNLSAFQAALIVDPNALELLEVQSELKDFNPSTDTKIDLNEVKIAWINANGQTINEKEAVIKLRFKAKKELSNLGDNIKINAVEYQNLIMTEAKEKAIKLIFNKQSKIESPESVSSIYPNPASDILKISHKGLEKINLTDSYGKTVLNINFMSAIDSTNLSITEIPTGIYFLNLEGRAGSYTEKLIIIH